MNFPAKEKKYIIHHEGDQLAVFYTLEEATIRIEYWERVDKRNGIYTPGYYQIKEEEYENIGAAYCRILPPIIPKEWADLDYDEVVKIQDRYVLEFANEALAAAEAADPDDREFAVKCVFNKFLNKNNLPVQFMLTWEWDSDARDILKPSLELTRDIILKHFKADTTGQEAKPSPAADYKDTTNKALAILKKDKHIIVKEDIIVPLPNDTVTGYKVIPKEYWVRTSIRKIYNCLAQHNDELKINDIPNWIGATLKSKNGQPIKNNIWQLNHTLKKLKEP